MPLPHTTAEFAPRLSLPECRPTPRRASRVAAGFTLIELMIVVVIVGILATVAIPNYSEYVRRSKIIEATSKLADHRVRMEQYFLDNRTYANAGACGVANPSYASGKDAFKVECTGATATTYLVTATGQDNMAGFAFTINQANVRATTAVPTSLNWHTNATCWVLRKDGSCT
jgi:type IV pilus assembly protein PilE